MRRRARSGSTRIRRIARGPQVAALNITEEDVNAEAVRQGSDPATLTVVDVRRIRKELAQRALDAKAVVVAPLVVVTQVRRGDEILSTTEQTITA